MGVRFTERLAERIGVGGHAPATVGLDPRLDAFPLEIAPDAAPADRIVAFYREVIPLLADHVAAVKPNIAFFERYGSAGFAAYEQTCALARDTGLLVVGDVKRGDIGSTAEAYAEAHFRWADALTLHPYLGTDSVEPFLRACRDDGRGVFVLVHTSNPSSRELQELEFADGTTVADRVADHVAAWGRGTEDRHGYGAVGAVVGATFGAATMGALRERLPNAWFLIPGVGAQGGSVADVAPAVAPDGLGVLVNQSRGVLQCFEPGDADWRDRIRAAVVDFAASLHALRSSDPVRRPAP